MAPVIEAGNALTTVASLTPEAAQHLAWGIEVGLLSEAEAQKGIARDCNSLLATFGKRFVAEVKRSMSEALGIAQIDDTVKHCQWALEVPRDSLMAEHYREFEADRIAWLLPAARAAFKRLRHHRRFNCCSAKNLWEQFNDIQYAIDDFDPNDVDASWQRYLNHPDTEATDEQSGMDAALIERYDNLFGSNIDQYAEVMASLKSAPRDCPWDSNERRRRSRAISRFIDRAITMLEKLPPGEAGCEFSMGDEMSWPGDAVVLLDAPGQRGAAESHFAMRYEGSTEMPGTDLGIRISAGQQPFHRAVHALAATVIVIHIDRLLGVTP